MALLLLIAATFFVCVILTAPFLKNNLPPGPIPLLSIIDAVLSSKGSKDDYMRRLFSKHGPIMTLYGGLKPIIFVLHSAAHEAMFQKGLVFSSRPQVTEALSRLYVNRNAISLSPNGPVWRLLRGNLSAKLMTSSAIKSFGPAREWSWGVLKKRIESYYPNKPLPVMDTFEFMMYSLLCHICFARKIEDEELISGMIDIHAKLVSSGFSWELNSLGGKFFFRKKWDKYMNECKTRDHLILPLVQQRRKEAESGKDSSLCYVDTLFDLQIPGEKEKLSDMHVVGLCSEILIGGAHTTTAVSQWIMGNLMKYPRIQEKLYNEIVKVVGLKAETISEEDCKRIPYLQAVVLEGLRRHPLGYAVIPHATSEDATLNGYSVPKGTTVMFVTQEAGFDPQIWENPMEFRPERFLNDTQEEGEVHFDVVGSKEIKMMPFGAGKRVCPGYQLGLLHLEYYIGNMVLNFDWKTVNGDDVDLEAAEIFSKMMVMKKPLMALVAPRRR